MQNFNLSKMHSNVSFKPTRFFQSLILILFCSLVFKINALDLKDTKISTSRDPIRASLCNYYTSSYSLQQRQQSKLSVQQYNYLSNQEIEKILSQKKYSFNSLTVLITMSFIISAVVLLFQIPPLFCCCAWPEKYPICKSWKKPEKEMYTKCELKWPAYFSLIFYIIILAGGIIGLIEGPVIIKKYNDLGCKNAAIFDDIIYGRISSKVDGKFFVGLSPLNSQLLVFNSSKLSTFYSDSTNSLSTANEIRNKQTLVETTIQTTFGGYVNSVYSNAFSGDGSTFFNVNSAFKTMYLGPSSDATKILGLIKSKLTVIFTQVNGALDNMITAFSSLQTTTESGVRTQINSFTSSFTGFKSQLQTYLKQVGAQFSNNKLYDQLFALLAAYYGIVFAFALLGFLASILITFCTVVRARLILYFTCGFLIFFALVGFAFLIYLVYTYPQMNQICHYFDQRLSSGTQTKALLQKIGYPHFADKITACMEDGSGKLINTFNPSFSDSLDQINVIAQGTLTFNNKIPSFTQDNIDNPFTTVYSTILSVKNSQMWDINDLTAIGHVNKVFDKSYTLGVTCNTVAISGDAWMPSFNLYTCPAGKSKMPACSDLSLQTTCPLGCYEILNEFVSPSGDPSYTTSLATRYDTSGGTSCNYYQYIVNLHNNWNVIRMNKMDTVNGSIITLKTTVDDYATKVSSVKASLNSFKTTLEANLDSMINLTSGSFNGVDCKVIGESIWEFRDAYCIGMIQSVRFNIICLCLICFGTLFVSCCVTCTGVRHLKHLQKLQTHSGYKGTPIQLSNTTIIQK